ncbi:hypothetical protein KIN34_04385 [Cellulomonas sp. DKR-3]|uniref:Uncharacterized protein n=1 Tax=Cellulomonas fulva TaxID=2835530 RepID=A0ABS5TWQ0_9CELL|nr:hypothetical protein [Cellulomonas fulva]MBT0993522.1 hypothetical protein [Cellulomonas fulva]
MGLTEEHRTEPHGTVRSPRPHARREGGDEMTNERTMRWAALAPLALMVLAMFMAWD